MASLDLEGIRLDAPGAARPLLSDVSLTLHSGELVALVGASGAGKTTLLEVAAGLRVPDAGSVSSEGRVGIAFQAPERMFFESSVQTEIAFALTREQLDEATRRARVIAALDQAGLDATFLERHPRTLSGGEQRLVALASVLVAEPRVVLLDEPTAGLDAGHAERVLALLRALAERGVAVLVATHEVDQVIPLADRVIALHRGAVVADGSPDEVYAAGAVADLVRLRVPVPIQALAGARVGTPLPESPSGAGIDVPASFERRRPRLPVPSVAGGMLTALLLALTFFLPAPLAILGGIALVAPVLAALAGVNLRGRLRLLLSLAALATFATVGHLLTAPGDPVFSAGPLQPTPEGLDAAARTWLRIIGPVLVGLAVTGMHPPVEVARALRRMLAALPLVRRLAAETALAVLLVIRLAPLMQGELLRIERAQRARSGDPATAPLGLERVRSSVSLGVPALIGTMLRAERLALAIELRGWSGHLVARGRLLRAPDLVWVPLAIAVFGSLVILFR